jgi:hypothetical protein
MSGEPTISEIEKRIAVVRQNIAGLVKQAAAFSGAGDEPRTADVASKSSQPMRHPVTFSDSGDIDCKRRFRAVLPVAIT